MRITDTIWIIYTVLVALNAIFFIGLALIVREKGDGDG